MTASSSFWREKQPDRCIGADFHIIAWSAAAGALNTANFRSVAVGAPADNNDFILYNSSNGALLYDADGNGAGAAVQFASLTGNPAITFADFTVI